MFRYIALAWEPRNADATALAHACAEALRIAPGWQAVLQHPRLTVFLTGAADGVNQAYLLHRQKGVVVGRLFDREQVLASSAHMARQLSATGDVAASGGRALIERYWGRYVAFFEDDDKTLHVLRDPSGALPCFHLDHGGVTVIASWLDDVLELLPHIPVPAVSRHGLAAHMAFGDLTGRQTALEGVTQVLAGERVALNAPCGPKGHLLWNASDVASDPVEPNTTVALATLRETVVTCSQAWASCYDPILLRLSGGVDSSILVSCLAEGRTPSRITCLNYHSVGARSDERTFARLAAARARRELIECERVTGFSLQQVFDVARTPAPHHYIGRTSSATDAEFADTVGAKAIFTGIGGDQLFFERRQWWPAADYLRVRGPDTGLPAAALDAARLGRISVWRTLQLALADRFRKRPPPLDLHTHRILLTGQVRQQAEHPGDFVHPVFTTPSRLPIGKLMQVQQMAYAPGYYDPFARERAPEQVNPLLSQPLIELCLRLPTYLLTLGGRGRGLVRKAFADELPVEIATRRSKGSMEEHTEDLLRTNSDFVRQILLDGELVRRGMIDRAATEAALSPHAAAPGWELVAELHFCLAAEAWLRRWSSRRG